MKTFLVITLLIAAGTTACKTRPSDVAASTVATPAAAVAPPEAPYIHSIGDTMKQEAASRPSGTPRAEDLINVAQAKGISLSEPRQVLANKVGAKYCSMTTTQSGLELSMCEFDSEAAAKQGHDFSLTAFASIPNRELHINRKTLLTLLRGPNTPSVQAEAKQAAELFAGL